MTALSRLRDARPVELGLALPAAVWRLPLALAAGAAMGALAGRLPLLATVGLLGAIVGGTVLWARPTLGVLAILAVTLGFIDWERLPLVPLGPVSLHLTDVALLALLGIVVVRLLNDRTIRLARTPLDLPVAGFVGAVFSSAAFAIVVHGADRSFVLRIVRPLAYYLTFFAVTNLVGDRRRLLWLINALLLMGTLAALAVLVQTVFPSVHLLKANAVELVTVERQYSGVERVYTQADRLIYPLLFVSAASVALRVGFLPRSLELARLGLLGIGLFLSFQRNYWATAAAMAALLFLLVPGNARTTLLKAAAVGSLAVVLLFSLPVPRLHSYGTAAVDRVVMGLSPEQLALDNSARWRLMETDYGLKSIAAHPLLGIGLGRFYRPTVADDFYISGVAGSIGLRWYMHNAYLWVWVTTGLVGLLPFVLLYGLAIWRGLRHWRRVGDARLRATALGITLGLLGQAMTNIVAPNFVQSWSLATFAVLLAVNELIFRFEGAT